MVSDFKMRFLGGSNAYGNGTIVGWEKRRFPSGDVVVTDFMGDKTPDWRPTLLARWNFELGVAERNPNL